MDINATLLIYAGKIRQTDIVVIIYIFSTNLSAGDIQIIKHVAWICSHIDAQLQIFARNWLVVSQNWILLIYIWYYVQKAFHSWFDRKCSSIVFVKCHKCWYMQDVILTAILLMNQFIWMMGWVCVVGRGVINSTNHRVAFIFQRCFVIRIPQNIAKGFSWNNGIFTLRIFK